MKTTPTVIALLLAVGFNLQPPVAAQDTPSPANSLTVDPSTSAQKYSVVDRGQHHRVWQSTTWNTNALGRAFANTNSYTELEIGMHRKTADGQWIESDPEIR